MGTLRRLRRVMEELEDKGVDTDDIVVDPKAVHVVVPDDEEETESNPEED